MGLHYFNIKHIKSSNALLCLSKDGGIIKCILFVTRRKCSGNFCYTAISNNQLTLDKYGMLKVIDEFNYNNQSYFNYDLFL